MVGGEHDRLSEPEQRTSLLPEEPEKEREKQAYQDTSDEREIESEVPPGVMYVTR